MILNGVERFPGKIANRNGAAKPDQITLINNTQPRFSYISVKEAFIIGHNAIFFFIAPFL